MAQWHNGEHQKKTQARTEKIKKRKVEQQTQFARCFRRRRTAPSTPSTPPHGHPCSMLERHSCCGAELPPRLQIVATSPSKVPLVHWQRASRAESSLGGLGPGERQYLVRDERRARCGTPPPNLQHPAAAFTQHPVQGTWLPAPGPSCAQEDGPWPGLSIVDVDWQVSTLRHTRALGPEIDHPPFRVRGNLLGGSHLIHHDPSPYHHNVHLPPANNQQPRQQAFRPLSSGRMIMRRGHQQQRRAIRGLLSRFSGFLNSLSLSSNRADRDKHATAAKRQAET